jgi:hypothetical protein
MLETVYIAFGIIGFGFGGIALLLIYIWSFEIGKYIRKRVEKMRIKC